MDQSLRPKRSDHFHSSAYGRAARGSGIGTTDTTSFGDRLHVERNRKNVRRYADSMIGMANSRETYRSKLVSPSEGNDYASRRVQARQARPVAPKPINGPNSAPPPQSSFREPPHRGFNPYA